MTMCNVNRVAHSDRIMTLLCSSPKQPSIEEPFLFGSVGLKPKSDITEK